MFKFHGMDGNDEISVTAFPQKLKFFDDIKVLRSDFINIVLIIVFRNSSTERMNWLVSILNVNRKTFLFLLAMGYIYQFTVEFKNYYH